jgi:hypothetical protein
MVEILRGEAGNPTELTWEPGLPPRERGRKPHLLDNAVEAPAETMFHARLSSNFPAVCRFSVASGRSSVIGCRSSVADCKLLRFRFQ